MERHREQQLRMEGENLLLAIKEIQSRLDYARQSFENVTDEALIDSYIYEIRGLHKKYEYLLREAKEMGLTATGRKTG